MLTKKQWKPDPINAQSQTTSALKPCVLISSLPDSTLHSPYFLYFSMQAYLHHPVRTLVYSSTVGFQQTSMTWISNRTVEMELSSYVKSFSVVPFQLYSADWLCWCAGIPEGISGQTKHCYIKPWLWLFYGGNTDKEKQWLRKSVRGTFVAVHMAVKQYVTIDSNYCL